MLSASANFLTKNALAEKKPAYIAFFEGEEFEYSTTRRIANPLKPLKPYIKSISGHSQSITPEEGKSSIGQIKVEILDKMEGVVWEDGVAWEFGDVWEADRWSVTALIATAPYNLHRRKCTVKAGYENMNEADFLTVFTGWVTDIALWSNALGYSATVTDPQKWLQRKIFRNAESASVTLVGNPLNILLQILTSTGDGTNGEYDVLAAENGLGIDSGDIDVTHIEEQRDNWFPGVSFSFTITDRITAMSFFETEIFKLCNVYPIVTGRGLFGIKVYHAPLPIGVDEVQEFDEDVIIGIPKWNQNLGGMINEVEIHYNWDGSDFLNIDSSLDSESIVNRGPGKKALEIKTKGCTDTEFFTRRTKRVFQRYAAPPPVLDVETFFNRQLSETGDVILVTHTKVPNLVTGDRGIVSDYMEIINRSVDWKRGVCKFRMLYTAWSGMRFAAISPAGKVLSGASTTVFTLETDQGAKFKEGWVISVFYGNMVLVAANQTITDITGDQITVTPGIGATPAAGWKIVFADYDNVAAEQKHYAFVASNNDKCGAAEGDEPYRIC